MIGVVVPVRDGAAHLRRCLRSILDQVAEVGIDADVVVVDGQSLDGSVEVARSVPGVRVLHQTGRGLAAGRNQGIGSLAPGCDLVAFCDSDDRWTAGSLRLRLDHLASRPAVGAVIGAVRRAPLPGESIPPAVVPRLDERQPGFTPGAMLVRRSTLDGVGGFDEALRIGADSDWFVRLTQSDFALDQRPEVVLEKGVRASSLSADTAAYRRELLQVARSYVQRRRSGAPGPADGDVG